MIKTGCFPWKLFNTEDKTEGARICELLSLSWAADVMFGKWFCFCHLWDRYQVLKSTHGIRPQQTVTSSQIHFLHLLECVCVFQKIHNIYLQLSLNHQNTILRNSFNFFQEHFSIQSFQYRYKVYKYSLGTLYFCRCTKTLSLLPYSAHPDFWLFQNSFTHL